MGWQDAPIVGQTKPAAPPRAATPAWQNAPVVSSEPQMPQPVQENSSLMDRYVDFQRETALPMQGAFAAGAAKGVGSVPFTPEMLVTLARNLGVMGADVGLNAVEGVANFTGRMMGNEQGPLFQSYDLGVPDSVDRWVPDSYSQILDAASKATDERVGADVTPNPEEWNFTNRMAYNVGDFLGSGLGLSKGLRAANMALRPENLAKTTNVVTKYLASKYEEPTGPITRYLQNIRDRGISGTEQAVKNADILRSQGKNVRANLAEARPDINEAVMAAGGGAALTGAQETEWQGDDLLAPLLGGMAASKSYDAATDLPSVLNRFKYDKNAKASEAVANRVASVLQEIAQDGTGAAGAARNIEDELRFFEGSGMDLPDPALMTDNPGIKSIRRTLAMSEPIKTSKGVLNPNTAITVKEGMAKESASRSVTDLLDPTADQDAPNRFIQGKVDETLEQGRNKISYLENDLQKAADEYELLSGQIKNNSDPRFQEVTSARLDTIIRQTQDDITKKKNEMYGKFDPKGTIAVDVGDLVSQVSSITKQGGQNLKAIPSNLIKQIQEEAENGVLSGRALLNFRNQASDAIDTLYKGDKVNGPLKDNLVKIKGYLDDRINAFNDDASNPELKDYFRARDFYTERFAPIAKQGKLGEFRDMTKGDKFAQRVDPKLTSTLFIGGRSSAGVEALQRLRKEVSDPKEFDTVVRDALISDMASKLNVARGRIAPQTFKKWVEDNSAVLDQIPEVKKEVQQMQQGILNKSGKVSELEAQVKAAKQKLGDTEKEIKTSAARLFLDGKDPIQAAKGLFTSNRKKLDSAQIKKMLDQDPTGDALKGFKQSLTKELIERVLNTGSGDPMSLNKVKRIQAEMEPVLQIFYSPEELARVKRGERIMELLDSKAGATIKGSATTENEKSYQLAQEIILRVHFGAMKGGTIDSVVNKLAAKNPLGIQASARELLYKSFLDPDVMAHLLKKNITTDNLPRWEKELTRFLTLKELGTQGDEDETEEMNITVRPGDKNLPETE